MNIQELNTLRNHPIRKALEGAYITIEGTLFEHHSDTSTLAQLTTLVDHIRAIKPKKVIEIGTAKSYFGFLLSQNCNPGTELLTFGIDANSATGVDILNKQQDKLKVTFVKGNSNLTVSDDHFKGADMAWIDGGHQYATAMSDIGHAMAAGVTVILVDDVRHMKSVMDAVNDSVKKYQEYTMQLSATYAQDSRGIAAGWGPAPLCLSLARGSL